MRLISAHLLYQYFIGLLLMYTLQLVCFVLISHSRYLVLL